MKRTTLQRAIPPLTVAIMAVLPGNNAWGTAHAANIRATLAATTAKTFKGSVEQMQQWGPIQVAIVVKNKKITQLKVSASAHTGRSLSIQGNAIPILKSETLKAQNANINEVSGATDTSGAYVQSLQAAVKKARKAKALK